MRSPDSWSSLKREEGRRERGRPTVVTVIGLINFRAGCEETVRKRSDLGWKGRSTKMAKKINEHFGLSALSPMTISSALTIILSLKQVCKLRLYCERSALITNPKCVDSVIDSCPIRDYAGQTAGLHT